MITHTQKRSWEAEQTMKWLQDQEWGIMVLDGKDDLPFNKVKLLMYGNFYTTIIALL